MICNKIAKGIKKLSKKLLQINSETITNEHDKETHNKDTYLQKKERKLLMIKPSKFKTKNWVEINDESKEAYDEDNQIRFKTRMLRSISL